MTNLPDLSPAQGMVPPGFYGPQRGPGVVAELREDLAIAALAARKGAASELAQQVQAAFGVMLPDGSRTAGNAEATFLGTAPGRWLVVSEIRADLAEDLVFKLGAHAAVTLQSDATLAFELSGPRVRELLAKGVAIDLDPAVFKVGDGAVTDIAHIGVTFWRTGADTYRFLVGRSYAAAFARFLVSSAAEYGLRFDRRG